MGTFVAVLLILAVWLPVVAFFTVKFGVVGYRKGHSLDLTKPKDESDGVEER